MKFSELDYELLAKSENIDYVYDLVMAGVEDYSKIEPTSENNPDFLVVLGCSPVPVKSRVIKTIELYKKGYGKYILLTGGKGWHKIAAKSEANRQRMIHAVKSTIDGKLTGEELSEKEKFVLQKYAETAEKEKIVESNQEKLDENQHGDFAKERVEKRILRLTEVQLMQNIFYSLGEIPPIQVFHEPFSNTTLENVKYSQKLMEDLEKRGEVSKINRIMLVTSCFHCRRAILTFRRRFQDDVEIMACPGTYDLKSAGMSFTKEDLLGEKKEGYYKKQIYNELNALINYSRNGSIADAEIEEFVGKETAKRIKKMHEEIER
ncbi:MAG: YdcF family protein [Clostridia bacterium]|nr:YdcF family protein [Clostridia bacterium]